MVSEVAYTMATTQMASSQQRYTGKPPTQTATSTSSPTIHWPTNLRWSRHCTAGQEHSAQMSLLRTKRPGTSGRPSSTTGTRVEYFNNMLHQLNQDPQMTRVSLPVAEHAWSHHHPMDWDNVRVLEQQPRLYHRLTLYRINSHYVSSSHFEQK